jgi:hypothetical protein
MTSELDIRPAADFALDASDTQLADVTVTSDAGWQMTLPEGRLGMTYRTGKTPAMTSPSPPATSRRPPRMRRAARPRRRPAGHHRDA